MQHGLPLSSPAEADREGWVSVSAVTLSCMITGATKKIKAMFTYSLKKFPAIFWIISKLPEKVMFH